MIDKSGERFADHPASWILNLVQLANMWDCPRLLLTFPSGAIRAEFEGTPEDRRAWLDAMVPLLRAGTLSQDLPTRVVQETLWSALAQFGGPVVLAASGPAGQEVKAVRLAQEASEWGQATLDPMSFLIQISSADDRIKNLQSAMISELKLYSCSDRTVVSCGHELRSFVPLSPRNQEEAPLADEPLVLGLWAFPGKGSIPLGRSFEKLDAESIQRQELTFGIFRSGLIASEKSTQKTRASTVVVFTHHERPTPSVLIWLASGVEVAQQPLDLPCQRLAVTLYREAPEGYFRGWDEFPVAEGDFEALKEDLDEVGPALTQALEVMVREYNGYSPGIEVSTLGCWSLLCLSSLALGGMIAPVLGSKLALIAGIVLAVGLVWTEFRFRHKKRFAIGQGLKLLVESLEEKGDKPIWTSRLTTVRGQPIGAP